MKLLILNISIFALTMASICVRANAATDPLAQACYNSICKDAVDIKSSLTKDNSIDELRLGKMQDMIHTYYSAVDKDSDINVARLRLMNLSQVQVSDLVSDLAVVLYAYQRLTENSQYVTFVGGEFQFDLKSYQSMQIGDSSLIDENIVDIFNTLFTHSFFLRQLLSGYDWADTVQSNINLTHETVMQQTQDMARGIETSIKKINAALGTPYIRPSVFKKLDAYQDLTTSEQYALMIDGIIADLSDLTAEPGMLQGIFKKSHFANTALYKKIMAVPLDSVVSAEKAINPIREQSCIKNVRKTIEASLTDSERNDLAAVVDTVRGFSKQVVQSLVKDPVKAQTALNDVSTVQFKLPDSRDSIQDAFEQTFANDIAGETPNDSNHPELFWGWYFDQAGAVLAQKNQMGTSMTDQECTELMPQALTDHEMSLLKNILLSVASGKDRRVGLAVAAHEVGHVVFHALTGGDGTPADLNALGADAPTMKCELAHLNGNSKYLNESFADDFSVHVQKLVTQASPAYAENLGCSLVQFLGVGPEIVNSDSTDVHPANFFRSLVFAQSVQGGLPNQCTQFLTANRMSSLASCY